MLNLKKIRLDKNYSINKLSKKTGISRAYITQLERDIYKNPTLDVILKLCKGLEVTPNELIKREHYE